MTHKVLSGNEILIQGALEAGFNLYTGYPGSPLADFFSILHSRKEELHKKNIKVVLANSEANAAAMASGAKMAGQSSLVVMKSMGLHVASDALSVGNFANPSSGLKAGCLIVSGDDPWSTSTSTPADSRYLFEHLHIPVFTPAEPQEVKDWMKYLLELSKDSSLYVGMILTTSIAEGGGKIKIGAEVPIPRDSIQQELDPRKFNLQENVMVPPNSLWADKEMIEKRFSKLKVHQWNLDKYYGNSQSKIGIITHGPAGLILLQVLEHLHLLEEFHVLKLACIYPLDKEHIESFSSKKTQLIIVEEKRDFLEEKIKSLLFNSTIQIFGKKFPNDQEGFPSFGGLNFEIILEKIYQLTNCQRSSLSSSKGELTSPARLPTFCPGCPHRETLSLLKEIRADLEKNNIKLISHGDVGCYSLSFLPPFKEMHDLSAMGQGGALASGCDLFTKNPSVVLMGDSTFFHSGMTTISHGLQANHQITYILLDNDNTAMTGHQMTPVSGVNVQGIIRPKQKMIAIVKALGVQKSIEVHPSDRYFYKNILMNFINEEGLKVIVSTKECGLTFQAKVKSKEKEFLKSQKTIPSKEFYQINTQSCEDCRVCVELTGCPGLTQTQDAYGPKMSIDPQICVSDSYCTKLKACPSFEKVTVYDYHPTLYNKNNPQDLLESLKKLPLNEMISFLPCFIVVTGVGGSGVTTISKILSQCAQEDPNEQMGMKFFDQKGLAQRNGAVLGHLCFYDKKNYVGPITPKMMANVLLSPDLLEAHRNIDYLKKDGGILVCDLDLQLPLSLLLDSNPQITPEMMREDIKNALGKRAYIFPFKKISTAIFQKAVYSNTMILGFVSQLGVLPFNSLQLLEALKKAVPKNEWENNYLAFLIGVDIYLHGLIFYEKNFLAQSSHSPTSESIENRYKESLTDSVLFSFNKRMLATKFHSSIHQFKDLLPDISLEYLCVYLHDALLFNPRLNMSEFFAGIQRLKELYLPQNKGDHSLEISLRTYAKTFFIKDEVFISHLLINNIKKEKDLATYKKISTSFEIMHINRPRFDWRKFHYEWDMHPKDWMLKLMRYARFIRWILPTWHSKEKEMAKKIRETLLEKKLSLERLNELDSIKGYREVRYRRFDEVFTIR